MCYISDAKAAVQRLHNCTAVHVETVPVSQSHNGDTIWDGNVEVFALEGCVEADCCYVWGRPGDRRNTQDFISVPASREAKTPTAAILAVLEWEAKHGNG